MPIERVDDCLQGDMAEGCAQLPYDSRQMALAFAPDNATAFFAFGGILFRSPDLGLS